jgi:rhodanese-related sulfurtransferase
VAEIIEQRGFGPGNALEGGFDAWQQAGYPTEAKMPARAGTRS